MTAQQRRLWQSGAMLKNAILSTILIGAFSAPALADAPRIVDAMARKTANGWTIFVTLAHPDTGWDHYADGWEILAPDGKSLGLRELAHPHVDEQPFTRSLSGVQIPDDLSQVMVRARCNTHGWGDEFYTLRLETETSGN